MLQPGSEEQSHTIMAGFFVFQTTRLSLKAWPNHHHSLGAHSKTAIDDLWPLQLGPSKAFSAQAEEK
jgi:hypothetical protein